MPTTRTPDPATGKGESTRHAILAQALAQASRSGLDGLSIGGLASALRMSKSGVFAHFGSKAELQLATLKAAEQRFADTVFTPALAAPKGLPRLRSMFAHWLDWGDRAGLPGGCIFHAVTAEFDDRPGAIRDALVHGRQIWRETLKRAARQAIDLGELPPATDLDQLAFEIEGMVLASHVELRLFRRQDASVRALRAFDRLTGRA